MKFSEFLKERARPILESQFEHPMDDVLKTEPAPVCKAYVDHLFRFTRAGTLAEGMAAILPCGWVYIKIGEKFTAGREIDDNHPYKAWLMTYSVPEFKTMVDWWFDILDETVQGYPQKELDHIKEIFIKSCLYEWMFWDMGWHKHIWKIQQPQ